MKFAHLADTHIKNLKYHYEYREVFNQLYEKLREEKVDYIIHCGDIAHTKTQLSPEFVEMCTEFFRSLADIAPTYIILGNHDGNLKNSSRQDALTPIVNALGHPSLFLLKESGETQLNNGFSINTLSVFDRDNWVPISDPGRINIALYHGSISNCETDLGWIMEYGEDDMSIFKGYDFAFLGDIHKTNQILDKKGRIRYAGSTVQQNHGETDDKGFLIWDIENKNTFTCHHVGLKNPKPFITIELTPKGRLPSKIKIPNNARLRLVSNNNLPLDVMKKAVEVAKHRFKPESITFLNRAAGQRGNVEDLTEGLLGEDLRDIGVQEELIESYLDDYQADEALMKRVLKLNVTYNSIVEKEEEISRNVHWKLDSFEWDNLFNYGENNKINFNKFHGVVGVFGKNFSGKSSIIDGLLYTLFNSTSKNERKNLNIINQNKESASGKLTISIGNNQYVITRNTEKYIKKLKGEETLEAKTNLEFECYDRVMDTQQSLNGLNRTETDKNIRRQFGTLEDFLLTSMSSQIGSLQFISEGSTRRKEILAKFLDLEIFDRKFKLAKDDASNLRGALKRLEEKQFDNDILEAEQNLEVNIKVSKEHHGKCKEIKDKISVLKQEITEYEKKIDQIPAELIDIEKVLSGLKDKDIAASDLIVEVVDLGEEIGSTSKLLAKINIFLDEFDIEELQERKVLVEERRDEISQLFDQIEKEEIRLKNQQKRAELLGEVPCGDSYSQCKFKKDAYIAIDELSLTKQRQSDAKNKQNTVHASLDSMEPERTDRYLEKYRKLVDKKNKLESELEMRRLLIDKKNADIKTFEREYDELQEKKDNYYDNKELIDSKEALVSMFEEIYQKVDVQERVLVDCEKKILEYVKEHGSLEQKLTSLKEEKQELADLQEEYSAYDLFMRCMHTSGISYDIIKKKLPVINNEIAKVLANVVEFEVFFEDDGKHLRIYIKHPEFEPRPIEMGSGAEKTIAAMAIRLALLSVSNLPKSDLFILDEPGAALDAENMDGFIRILDLVKSYFKTVLLISHLDSLKDCVDMEITIDKNEGFAHVMEV